MAIVSLSESPDSPKPSICAICDVRLTLETATAGLLDAHGQQAYACVSHFSEPTKLILGWADFAARQRLIYLNRGEEPNIKLYGKGGGNAWLDS